MSDQPASYAAAGVDIDAGDRAVELMRAHVEKTFRPGVLGGIGGFAGLFELDLSRYRRPVLATSTDGVGTKLAIAQLLDVHDTVGIDLVAMVVDDLVVCGAEPLFMTDYIACGRVVPERMEEIVKGISAGCVDAGCALIGGETAEHPGLLGPDDYDLAGAAVGVVEADRILGTDRVQAGDVLVALASSGLHSNGFALVRHVLGAASVDLSRPAAEFGLGERSLGAALLTPTRIYARDCLALIDDVDVHAFAHITGGGIAGNLARILPSNLDAHVDRTTWPAPAIFRVVQELGNVPDDEMERTFNLGIGMIAVVSRSDAQAAITTLQARDVPAWTCGEVTAGSGQARLTG